jgi:hypothetical protein
VVDVGVQAISMSFGVPYGGSNHCIAYRNSPECLVNEYSVGRDVAMIAASGNSRTDLNFPASDRRIISVGGFEEDLTFWDEAPTCPPDVPSECGSNYSTLHSGQYFTHQELLGSAKHVLSTTYFKYYVG